MRTLRGHTKTVQALAYSPDGLTLASAGDDRTVRAWRLDRGTVRTTLEGHTDAVLTLAFSPDGKILASAGYDRRLRLWAERATGLGVGGWEEWSTGLVAGGRRAWQVVDCLAPVTGLAFSTDADWLAIGCDLRSNRGSLAVRRLSGSKVLLPAPDRNGYSAVWCLGFSPDGTMLAVGYANGQVVFWDMTRLPASEDLVRCSGWNFMPHPAGVNALAHRWLEDVPVSLAVSERYFIQMDPDLAEPRASIWGMDNATTQIKWGLGYIAERYSTPCGAWSFWQGNGWY